MKPSERVARSIIADVTENPSANAYDVQINDEERFDAICCVQVIADSPDEARRRATEWIASLVRYGRRMERARSARRLVE